MIPKRKPSRNKNKKLLFSDELGIELDAHWDRERYITPSQSIQNEKILKYILKHPTHVQD